MALVPRLDLRQSQSLVMTPQLQQAIKLLQLSNLDLQAFVDQEIERNPLLERGDPEAPAGNGPDNRATLAERAGSTDTPTGADTPAAERLAGSDVTGTDRLASSDHVATDQPLDTDYQNVWSDAGPADIAGDEAGLGGAGGLDQSAWQSVGNGGRGFDDDLPSALETLSQASSLRDHLLEQVAVEIASPAERLIAAYLVDSLDASGYLASTVEAAAEHLGCPVGAVQDVLGRLQRFDPPGVFARSLAECLALQLRERDRLDPAMQAFLDNLDLLASRNYQALSKRCGVDLDDIADMVAEIRALNPKPGLDFETPVAQTLVPDVLLRANPAGGWIVELNGETLPKVLINQSYYAEISAIATRKQDKEFIGEAFQSANWLVKSLHQRATTIIKVAGEIVRQQDAFFVHGVSHLRPLILRDVAEAIGMHESTVSRVTSNKYIATPRGVFELKYFFTAAVGGANGQDAHSAEAVRFRIKAMIDAEAPTAVLSDDAIVARLKREGVDIARRTVAKYREGMRIPSSVQRRREKAMRSAG